MPEKNQAALQLKAQLVQADAMFRGMFTGMRGQLMIVGAPAEIQLSVDEILDSWTEMLKKYGDWAEKQGAN
jgi:hypothetical protein